MKRKARSGGVRNGDPRQHRRLTQPSIGVGGAASHVPRRHTCVFLSVSPPSPNGWSKKFPPPAASPAFPVGLDAAGARVDLLSGV